MGYEWSQCWHRLRRIIQPDLLALSFLTRFLCHCLFDSPYIFIFFFWIIWKWNYPLLLKFLCSRAPKCSQFQLVWLATQITFFSFSYWYCSLSNQLWLQTSLRTPTNLDFIKCLPWAMAASDYPPSPQSTPHKWPDSFRLPPTHWLDIPYMSKMLHALPHYTRIWEASAPHAPSLLSSRVYKDAPHLF